MPAFLALARREPGSGGFSGGAGLASVMPMDMKLEVVPIPVRDVDAAKDFYTRQVGFRLDHHVQPSPAMRVVQMTPPGSACSVVLGVGLPLGEPGAGKGVQLVAEDIVEGRAEMAGRGVPVSE